MSERMVHPRRRVVVAVTFAFLMTGLLMLQASPARADRCQPEELFLVDPEEGPMDERDSPLCTVTDYYVYPFICPSQDPPNMTLTSCLANIDPDLDYRPPLIPPYRPNLFRIYCNAYLWTWQQLGQTPTCTF